MEKKFGNRLLGILLISAGALILIDGACDAETVRALSGACLAAAGVLFLFQK